MCKNLNLSSILRAYKHLTSTYDYKTRIYMKINYTGQLAIWFWVLPLRFSNQQILFFSYNASHICMKDQLKNSNNSLLLYKYDFFYTHNILYTLVCGIYLQFRYFYKSNE